MRTNATGLAGIQTERTMTDGPEMHREDVFDGPDYIGQIVYAARKRQHGTEWGWRPAKMSRAGLTTKRDAIAALERARLLLYGVSVLNESGRGD